MQFEVEQVLTPQASLPERVQLSVFVRKGSWRRLAYGGRAIAGN
jgi:hypothetical protein